MRWQLKRAVYGGENGFSLVELLIAIAIIGVITTGIASVFIQTYKVTAESNHHLQAIGNVQNIGQWVVRDGQQAATVDYNPTPVTGGTRYLRLNWDYSTYSLGKHRVDYVLQNDDVLRRDDTNYIGGVAQPTTSLVLAQNIVAFSVAGPSPYEVTISSTVGSFQQGNAEMKYYFNFRISSS
jgi:prepilin-type N-terminal cleavage/methylation domain-containing protein